MSYLYGIDVETTGLDPAKDVIIEIALVVYDKAEGGEWQRKEHVSSLVRPYDFGENGLVPAASTQVNGICSRLSNSWR